MFKQGLKSDFFWLQKALDQTLPETSACRVLVLHLFSLHRPEAVLSNGLNLCVGAWNRRAVPLI